MFTISPKENVGKGRINMSTLRRVYRVILKNGIYHKCGDIAVGTNSSFGLGSPCLLSRTLEMTNGFETIHLEMGVNQTMLCGHCFTLEDRMKIVLGRYDVEENQDE
jgi:hypothetical protein